MMNWRPGAMAMLWKRDQLDAVRRLMREQRYHEARALLAQIDHPHARTLLAQLDARRQRGRQARAEINHRLNMTYTLTAAMLFVLAVVGCGVITAMLSATRLF